MKRILAFPVIMVLSLASMTAQDLPKDGESFEVEPPLLLLGTPEKTPTPRPNVEKLTRDLERAKKGAAPAERLYKAGVLAKVEAERRLFRVVQLQSDLAKAQLSEAEENVARQQDLFAAGEISKAEVEEAQATLKELTQAAQTAASDLKRAELEAAMTNLRRQQKLLALGSARKSDVTRAEEKLAALQRDAH